MRYLYMDDFFDVLARYLRFKVIVVISVVIFCVLVCIYKFIIMLP